MKGHNAKIEPLIDYLAGVVGVLRDIKYKVSHLTLTLWSSLDSYRVRDDLYKEKSACLIYFVIFRWFLYYTDLHSVLYYIS